MMEDEAKKNREATERRLLGAVDALVCGKGFESLGINVVAAKAEVSKMLIYRYFGSLDGLIAAYLTQHDFWANYPGEVPQGKDPGDYIKHIFREQVARMRGDYALRKIIRWELTSDNPTVERIREIREERGKKLIETVSRLCGRPVREVAPLATLLSAAVTHLTMLADHCGYYNEIPLRDDEGWRQLTGGIDRIVDLWLGNKP